MVKKRAAVNEVVRVGLELRGKDVVLTRFDTRFVLLRIHGDTQENKTLELFGESFSENGATKHRAFHSYTMKQAIQERFILDVLKSYTPVGSYYRLVKTVEGDPEFDVHRANKKLRKYVEGNEHAVRVKGEIMVDHFHEQVIALNKIGGQARAMVVTDGVDRAIKYFHAISAYLTERKRHR